jgi:hypothetical protein
MKIENNREAANKNIKSKWKRLSMRNETTYYGVARITEAKPHQ